MREDAYRVELNKDWRLQDLYEFPHAFLQCYSFVYCLDSDLDPRDRERIDAALRSYPWRGGYSYVNIYNVFSAQIPKSDRPKIASIYKASPGWIDLILNKQVASDVAISVVTLMACIDRAKLFYKKCAEFVASVNEKRRKRKLATLKSSVAEMRQFNSLCTELAKNLGFRSLEELHERTGNPEVSLKLLMAHYRRTRILLGYAEKGKATLTLPAPKR